MFWRAFQLCWSKCKAKQSWEILKGSAIILAHIIVIIRRRKRRRRTRGERGCRRLLENWWRARLCKLDPEMNKWPSPPSPPPSSPSPSSPSRSSFSEDGREERDRARACRRLGEVSSSDYSDNNEAGERWRGRLKPQVAQWSLFFDHLDCHDNH